LFYKQSFERGSLNSEELNELFHEVAFYVQGLRIEVVSIKGNHLSNEKHPAATIVALPFKTQPSGLSIRLKKKNELRRSPRLQVKRKENWGVGK
jgi:hypothetical protein